MIHITTVIDRLFGQITPEGMRGDIMKKISNRESTHGKLLYFDTVHLECTSAYRDSL